jgi:hypothetical protein
MNIDVPMLFGESQLRGKMLTDEISIQKSDRASTCFQKLGHQNISDRRLARARKSGKEDRRPLLVTGGKLRRSSCTSSG